MQLRSSELLGTDLVALSLWPDADDLGGNLVVDADRVHGGGDAAAPGLPWEARCVDAALAAALEDLVEREEIVPGAPPTPGEGDEQRAARAVLRWLLARAQRLQRRTD